MKPIIKFSIITSLLLVLVALTTQTSYSSSAGTLTQSNFAGGSTAVAYKDVIVTTNNSWNGQIRSYMSPSYNIGTIGWTWWTIRELCSGIIIDQYQYGGQVYYNADYIADSAVDDMDSCTIYRYGTVMGTHDFKNGSSVWQPYFFHSEPIY